VIANLFGTDLGLVVIIALVVLIGGSQLPKIARNAGLAGKEFREAHQHEDGYAEGKERTDSNAPGAVLPPSVMSDRTAPAPGSDEPSIQLSPAQLDALLKAREEQTRRQG